MRTRELLDEKGLTLIRFAPHRLRLLLSADPVTSDAIRATLVRRLAAS